MHHEPPLLLNIAVALVIAFAGGLIARRFGLPPLVGYLFAGMAIGPFTPELFGVSLALGAFLAGVVLGESSISHQVGDEVLPFRETFAVLFFVSVGMLVNINYLLDHAGLSRAQALVVTLPSEAAAEMVVAAGRLRQTSHHRAGRDAVGPGSQSLARRM